MKVKHIKKKKKQEMPIQPLLEAHTKSQGKEITQPVQLRTRVRKRKIVGSYDLKLRSYQIPRERDYATYSARNGGAEAQNRGILRFSYRFC